jgi:hypothetical protein
MAAMLVSRLKERMSRLKIGCHGVSPAAVEGGRSVRLSGAGRAQARFGFSPIAIES